MPTERITKERAIELIRGDIEQLGKPRPRRHYAARWNMPPSTVYDWIQAAVYLHEQRNGNAGGDR